MGNFDEPDGWASRPIENADKEKDALYERIDVLEARLKELGEKRDRAVDRANRNADLLTEAVAMLKRYLSMDMLPSIDSDAEALVDRLEN